jgi:hypothetical protein
MNKSTILAYKHLLQAKLKAQKQLGDLRQQGELLSLEVKRLDKEIEATLQQLAREAEEEHTSEVTPANESGIR